MYQHIMLVFMLYLNAYSLAITIGTDVLPNFRIHGGLNIHKLNHSDDKLDELIRVPLTKRHVPPDRLYKRDQLAGVAYLDSNQLLVLFSYFGQVSFGTPSQSLTMLFDTGSTLAWIRSKLCATCNKKAASFNRNSSMTFSSMNQTANPIQYADGTTIQGVVASDIVAIAGLAVTKFQFVEATSLYNIRADDPADGILGFSLPLSNTPTWFSSLVSQKKVASPIFSYWIDQTSAQGEFILGGIDPTKYIGNITKIPVTTLDGGSPNQFWSSVLTGVSTNNQNFSLPNQNKPIQVAFDTGTSFILLPLETAQHIHAAMPGAQPTAETSDTYTLWTVDCDHISSYPPLTFTFGRTKITIQPADYTFVVPNQNSKTRSCMSGIGGSLSLLGSKSQINGLMGNIFLRAFYTVWNVNQQYIGFAIANRTKVPGNQVSSLIALVSNGSGRLSWPQMQALISSSGLLLFINVLFGL